MLALIEPCIMDGLPDLPHLGCAMLIAACKEKSIKTTLVNGQTRYLKDIFVTDSEELWYLIQDLKENALKKIGAFEYKKSIQENGQRKFQEELKNLYQYVMLKKDSRNYFNCKMVTKFNNLYSLFIKIYFYYLKELNCRRIKIVDRYVSEILKSNPRYAGFSLQSETVFFSQIIIKRVKKLTGIPIVAGGALTPFMDLKKLDKIFDKGYFDYLVIGAGEQALPSLIETLEDKKSPKGIANIFYKKDGKVKINELKIIDNLDSLPFPDYSQFNLDLYLPPKRILPLQTARGCSWGKCAFCSHHNIYLGKYRTFSIEKVINSISHLQKTYNCSHFVFHDEELPFTRAKEIGKAVLNNKLEGISIYAYARPTSGYNNNKLLGYLRKSGFSTFAWGIESGCQKILDSMDKGTKVTEMSQILEKSSGNGIFNLCFIFFGFPGETNAQARQTIEFLKGHSDYIEDILLAYFTLSPYSPIEKDPGKWGVKIKKGGSYSIKNGMNPQQVIAFYSKFDKESQVNSLKVTSGKLNYFFPRHNRRMLHFLNSSYGFLHGKTALVYLRKKKLNKIFPIVSGEVKTKNGRNVFQPINITETNYINTCFPVKEIGLDNLEKNVFNICNGTLSIENIITVIYNEFKNKYTKKYIRKRCVDFFLNIFSKNWGLCFAKSWGTSYDKSIKQRVNSVREPQLLTDSYVSCASNHS